MALTIMMALVLPVAALSFNMELKPRNLVLRAGDTQVLTCSANDCSESPRFVWTSLEDKPLFAEVIKSESESHLIFNPVTTAHENFIVCKVACGSQQGQLDAQVKVYSFPNNPVISGNDHMLVGQENTLTCEVPEVYPSEYLEVEWIKGAEVVHTDEGRVDVATVSSRYTYTPTVEDNGKTITCRARHNFEGVPEDQKIKDTIATLNVQYAPRDIKISDTTTVKIGGNFTLTCNVEGNPRPLTVWRKLGAAGQSVEVGRSETLVLHYVTVSEGGKYVCEAQNTLGALSATVNVIVQAPPRNTSILVSPARGLREGDNMTISCHSDSGPTGIVSLYRVSEDPRTKLNSDLGSSTSITLTSIQLGDSGLYECESINEHGSQRVSAQVSVAVHPLEVELIPGEDVITVEKGENLVLTCRAVNCSNPVFFWKSLLDGPIHSRTENQDSLSKLVLSPVELRDERAYTCEVECGSIRKSKHAEIKVFSFPNDPVIESSQTHLEGKVSRLHCTVRDVFPASLLQIQWLDGDRVLLSEEGSFSSGLQNVTSTLSFTPRVDEQGRKITCRALLKMDGVPMNLTQRSAMTSVNVHYAPRNISIKLGPNNTLKEGESLTISCNSESVPTGLVSLYRGSGDKRTKLKTSPGSSTSFTLTPIQLGDSGPYECESINEYGNQTLSAQVTVKGPPRNTTVQVLPSPYVHEGQNVTICCRSVSFPPPAVILKLGNGTELYSPDGNFTLLNLTASDAGQYQVNVTNDLGYETEIFTISVLERQASPPPSWNDFIIPLIGLGTMVTIATATGLVIHYLNQARKRGSYKLAKCKPNTV